MGKLLNKVAVVTGAAQGIGARISERLLEDGATVAMLDVNFDHLEQTANKLDPLGERVLALKCDVADQTDVKNTFSTIYEKLGKIDILINNAGITRDAFLPLVKCFVRRKDTYYDLLSE
ncbi:SDR family NAD(P)-dependent oxidoreductase [Sporosarcina newyorkensis]|uniref:SDR family NAD(P)-dependent oxidoreductase n=1 Tax=Sporosarcina newyorkensis TaxID=759851 RepID=UPI00031845D2|nr:SDR family NAD(P)-dependent oxidoreductase [Sporosarcina newyorkensis]